MLRVGMHPVTLCVTSKNGTQSVPGSIPTQSVGTIICETFQHFLESEVYRRLSGRMLGNLRSSRYHIQDRQERIR